MADLKEVKELYMGVESVTLVVMKALKDGFQAGEDIATIVGHLVSSDVVKAAYSDLDKLDMTGFDLADGVELGQLVLATVPKVIDCLKVEETPEPTE